MVTDRDILHGKYLKICEQLQISGLENFDITQLLFNELWYVQFANWKNIIGLLIRVILYNEPISPDIEIIRRNDDLLLMSTIWHRTDHDNYWKEICSFFPEYTQMSFSGKRKSFIEKMRSLKWKMLIANLDNLIRTERELKTFKNFKHQMYLATRLVEMKKIYSELEKIDLSPKLVMCFFDSGFYENLAIQYYKMQGAITVTNQHGQPVFRSSESTRLEQSQILNFKSDYFLAKGEFTREQFIKAGIDGEKVKVVGNINIFDISQDYKERKKFGVFLNCITLPDAYQRNLELLKIAQIISEHLGYSYYLKVHPTDNVRRYNIDDRRCIITDTTSFTLIELCRRIDFGIFDESAIYLDLLQNRVKAYRWNSYKDFPLVFEERDLFNDVNELISKFKIWRMLSNEDKEKYLKKINSIYNGTEDLKGNIKETVTTLM